jgi:hypothetical protein
LTLLAQALLLHPLVLVELLGKLQGQGAAREEAWQQLKKCKLYANVSVDGCRSGACQAKLGFELIMGHNGLSEDLAAPHVLSVSDSVDCYQQAVCVRCLWPHSSSLIDRSLCFGLNSSSSSICPLPSLFVKRTQPPLMKDPSQLASLFSSDRTCPSLFWVSAQASDHGSNSLGHLISLFVERSHQLWKPTDVLDWLLVAATAAADVADSKRRNAAATTTTTSGSSKRVSQMTSSDIIIEGTADDWACVARESFPAAGRNEYGHLRLADFSDNVNALPQEEMQAVLAPGAAAGGGAAVAGVRERVCVFFHVRVW